MRARSSWSCWVFSLVVVLSFTAWAGASTPPAREAPRTALEPSLPRILWDSSRQVVFATAPDEVNAWLAGGAGDPTGSLARWNARYEAAQRTPGFAAALVEIQRIVTESLRSRELGSFEINHTVIPRILADRTDLRRELIGEGGETSPAEAVCYKEITGELYCSRLWGPFCLEYGCEENDNPVTKCIIKVKIRCPDGAHTVSADMP